MITYVITVNNMLSKIYYCQPSKWHYIEVNLVYNPKLVKAEETWIYVYKLLWSGRSALTFGNRYMDYDAGHKNGEKKT